MECAECLAVALLGTALLCLAARSAPIGNYNQDSLPANAAMVAVEGRLVAYGDSTLLCRANCVRLHNSRSPNGSWASVVGVWGGRGSAITVAKESWTLPS
jgi:hypothetical protein